MDGRLVPGDRLIFVNEVKVEHATLDEAVQALKGAGRGTVQIGVAKPLPLTSSVTNSISGVTAGESNVDDNVIDDAIQPEEATQVNIPLKLK